MKKILEQKIINNLIQNINKIRVEQGIEGTPYYIIVSNNITINNFECIIDGELVEVDCDKIVSTVVEEYEKIKKKQDAVDKLNNLVVNQLNEDLKHIRILKTL
jgi:hypothetical protein